MERMNSTFESERTRVTEDIVSLNKLIPKSNTEARTALANVICYLTDLENTLDKVPGGWSFFRKGK
jgi:hypothetical protein